MITHFDEVVVQGRKSFKCSCGRRIRLRKKFFQTINPFNKNKDNSIKTRDEIAGEILKERATWLTRAEPCIHKSVEEKP